jgi:steroid 5-alpha reductase family enzyme
MHIFKANTENKGKTMNKGLWKYSRHPNYLGEVGFWFGLCGFGLTGTNGSIFLLICPIAMLLMFMFASIPMMDNRSLENRPDYANYMKKTSSLMLLPSKK